MLQSFPELILNVFFSARLNVIRKMTEMRNVWAVWNMSHYVFLQNIWEVAVAASVWLGFD